MSISQNESEKNLSSGNSNLTLEFFDIAGISRSSPSEVILLVKGVLKVCSKFTGEHQCQSVISTKLLFSVSATYHEYMGAWNYNANYQHIHSKNFQDYPEW